MNFEKITIRPAVQTDLPQILDIFNYAILNTTSVYAYEPHTLEMRKKWPEERRTLNQPVLVAEIAPQPPKGGEK